MTSRSFIFLVPLLIIGLMLLLSYLERRKSTDPNTKGYFEKNGKALGTFFICAVGFWMILLIILPYLYMVIESFHPKLPMKLRGGPTDLVTLDQYKSFFIEPSSGDWNTTHFWAFFYTIIVSISVTFFNFAICYPVAFYLAQSGKKMNVRFLMLALVVPYWVNEILRAFSLRLLLTSKGVINQVLLAMGLIDSPIDFLGLNIGLYVGLSYAYLLIMMFPLYNAIESLDKYQIEAAYDLGAPRWKIHRDIVIPYSKPGIASGCTMVFMLCAGSLAAPQFLGGPSTLWFTSIVYDFFFQSFNWPRGAAYAFLLLSACVAFVMITLRVFKVSLGESIK